MNLIAKNFFKTRLQKQYQEIGGEPQKVWVNRYGYESHDKIYDLDILEHTIIISGKQLKSLFSVRVGNVPRF